MRVFQVTPALNYGDAVSNDALAIRRILREEGYESDIYALILDSRLPEGEAYYLDEMPEPEKEDILLYHGAIGTELTKKLEAYTCKKVMIFHNITPPEFFRPYSRTLTRLTEMGYAEIREMVPVFDRCIADSEYNKQTLREQGYECEIDVCPIVIPFEDYEREPDEAVLEKYRGQKGTNLLFVGRIVPNKKQEDIIRAYAAYREEYDPDARLFLVGTRGTDMEKYEDRVKEYIKELGLEGEAILTGHVSFREILAYYRLADAFVCMSEHEGFCVPLLEAMKFGKPIVAYKAGAVPDTLGDGGLLLEEKEPYTVAAAVNRIVKDEGLRNDILKAQERILGEMSYESVKKIFLKCFGNIIQN